MNSEIKSQQNLTEFKNIPNVVLTDNQRIWLIEIWHVTQQTGEVPEYKQIRRNIINKIANDFIPTQINNLFVENNLTEITLLGVIQIADNFENILSDINKIILAIRQKLIQDPDFNNFSIIDIAKDLKLGEQHTRILFKLAGKYGTFWDSAGSNISQQQFGFNKFTINHNHIIDFYFKFSDIKTTINLYFERQQTYASESNLNQGVQNNISQTVYHYFIDPGRIEQLKMLKQNQYDLAKLIQLCIEMNTNFNLNNYYSIALLTRAIIDHIPPIFNLNSFNEFANNYASENNIQSFKKQMIHLNNSLRNVGDSSIHSKIRKSETLPNITQVDFRSDLDVLLAEIVRVLK